MSNLQLHEGAGSLVFSDDAAGTRRSIRIFYFRPRSSVRDAPIVIAMHGIDRAASEFRDVLAGKAERNRQIVLVPEFDAEAFPDMYAYNFGNVRLAPPSPTVLPRNLWNFGIIDRLFRQVRISVGSDRDSFGLFGNSAGSQYVLRYLALTEAAAVDVAVASNSGMYMLPDLTVDYPIGMGGLDLDESCLRRYLGRHLTILLGDADADSAAPDLPRIEAAMAQGPHRLARGLWHYEHCKKLADRLNVPFGWKLEIVPGAGHVSQQIFDRAVNILAN
jgi:poly(3-hydroxybutyrate) depolymerase